MAIPESWNAWRSARSSFRSSRRSGRARGPTWCATDTRAPSGRTSYGQIYRSRLIGTATFFGTLGLDLVFGFAGRFQDFDFKFLGEKEMLAVVHAKYLPARQCAADGGRTICPEDWELRHVYIVEA